MMRFPRLALGCLLALGAVSAHAQMLPPDQTLVPFTRYMAVRERTLTGYDAPGVRVGAFTLRPELDVTGNYNDNVFAVESPRAGAGYVAISPSAQLQSNWADGSLNLNASGEIDRFLTHTTENTETVAASAYGLKDLGSTTRVRAIVRYNQGRESRESQNAFVLTDRPIRYETETGAIGISHRFASVLVSADTGVTRSHFFDGQLNGQSFSQQYRNNDDFQIRLRTELAQSQSLSYFAQVTRDATNYNPNRTVSALNQVVSFPRESENYEILGGVRFELPVLARGEIGLGYQNSSFRNSHFRTFSGLAVNSKVLFFPTQLLTITVDARRSVNDSGVVRSANYVALSAGLHVDYELLRTLILGAGTQLERDTFNGLDRRDGRVGFNGTVDWRFTPRLWLRGAYDRLDLTSDGADRYKAFVRNRFTLGIGVRL